MMFQSTHPRGVRLEIRSEAYQRYVSIHAPARGATYNEGCLVYKWLVSIHAPARGAT